MGHITWRGGVELLRLERIGLQETVQNWEFGILDYNPSFEKHTNFLKVGRSFLLPGLSFYETELGGKWA